MATVLVISSIAVFAQDTNITETGFVPMTAQEYDALCSMELLTEDLLNMSANAPVSRAQFVGALYKLAGYSEVDMDTPFVDVNDDTPYKNAISYFYNTKIINGTSSTTFSPNSTISYYQAIKVIVDFMGYKVENTGTGEYSGHLGAAYRYGLVKGIKATSFEDALSAEAAVVLLYNCAIAELPETFIYKNDGNALNRVNEDICILSAYHGIYSNRGRVEVSYNGELALGEYVVIGNRTYYTGGKDFSEYLGLKVRYFSKSDSVTDVLLWVVPEQSNSILTITADELLTDDSEYDFDKIVYKKGKKSFAEIDLYADIIYNNAICNNCTIEQLKPGVGDITLIDNNSDLVYDTVIVRDYRNIFVGAVSVVEKFIADKYGSPIMLDEYEYVKIIKDGEEITLNELANNCVVSCLQGPDKKFLYVYVNDSGKREILRTVSSDADKTLYGFDSGEYALTDELIKVMNEKKYETPEIKIGNTYAYFLDIAGNIAAITEVDNGWQYAYLISVYPNNDALRSDSVCVEMLLQDGTETIVVTAKKLKIDGLKNKCGKDLPEDRIREVVKVSFNSDGELKEIDYAEVLDEAVNPFGYDKTRFTIDYPEVNTMYFRNYVFANRYTISGNTVCFAEFADQDGGLDYGIVSIGEIPSNTTYTNLKIYDCDEYRDIGALCINLNRRDRFNSGHILLDRIVHVRGEDGEFYPQLIGLVNGNEVKYTLEDESLISGLNLKRGDIVRCSTFLNVVYSVELFTRLSDENWPLVDTTNLGSQSESRVMGYLYSNNGSNIVLYNPNGWTYGGKLLVTRATSALSNLRISVYDKKTDTVYPGSAKDLYHTTSPQLDGSIEMADFSKRVFIWRENVNIGEIIVALY